MRHTKALRYNDKSVLENHHCAIAFKLLLDPQNDVFELLSEAQYWNVRQTIVKMIISSDISNHFELISKCRIRVQIKQANKFALLRSYQLYYNNNLLTLVFLFCFISDF